jgi:hypothetical protein
MSASVAAVQFETNGSQEQPQLTPNHVNFLLLSDNRNFQISEEFKFLLLKK